MVSSKAHSKYRSSAFLAHFYGKEAYKAFQETKEQSRIKRVSSAFQWQKGFHGFNQRPIQIQI